MYVFHVEAVHLAMLGLEQGETTYSSYIAHPIHTQGAEDHGREYKGEIVAVLLEEKEKGTSTDVT